jgi:hypothetical protein
MKVFAAILILGLTAGAPVSGLADTTTDPNSQVTTMNNLSSSPGQTKVINKISGDFSSFLGSDANAVVTGLRNGTPITLNSTTTTTDPTTGLPVTTTTPTVITPPTGHMGFGNVYISLALAKQQLSALGITQPTPEQLQAALTGGTITQTTGSGVTATTTTTSLQGILTMRSQNMGWGQIAQKLGFKLGPVIAGMKSANHSLAATTSAASKSNNVNTASGKTNGSSNHGIVSASGKSQNVGANGVGNGKGLGAGIVSAAGRSNGNAYGLNHGSDGIVTGSGHSAGVSGGIVSAGGGNGNGSANGKGHNK